MKRKRHRKPPKYRKAPKYRKQPKYLSKLSDAHISRIAEVVSLPSTWLSKDYVQNLSK